MSRVSPVKKPLSRIGGGFKNSAPFNLIIERLRSDGGSHTNRLDLGASNSYYERVIIKTTRSRIRSR